MKLVIIKLAGGEMVVSPCMTDNYPGNNGTCIACPLGFYGVDCSQRCPVGHYGQNCLQNCTECRWQDCVAETGCKLDEEVTCSAHDNNVHYKIAVAVLGVLLVLVGMIALTAVGFLIKKGYLLRKSTRSERPRSPTTVRNVLSINHYQSMSDYEQMIGSNGHASTNMPYAEIFEERRCPGRESGDSDRSITDERTETIVSVKLPSSAPEDIEKGEVEDTSLYDMAPNNKPVKKCTFTTSNPLYDITHGQEDESTDNHNVDRDSQ